MIKKLYRKIPILRELFQIRDHLAALRTLQAHEYIAALKASGPRYNDLQRLIGHGYQVNSEHEEDGMIAEVFRRIGTTDKVFVEIGVGAGSENNTAFLAATGWTGFWLDQEPSFLATLASRPGANKSIRGWAGMITDDNVIQVLSDLGVPERFDLLSLDIDYGTYHVWAAFSRQFKPRVVVVEYNAAFPAAVEWVVPRDGTVTGDDTLRFGGSLKSYELLGSHFGYSLVGCDIIGANAFFVRSDLTGDHFCAPFTSENHYEPPRYFAGNRGSHRASFLA